MANETTNPTFRASRFTFSRLWHCFGSPRASASLSEVIALLQASETTVLPINTHSLSSATGREGLEIGFAGVTLDEVSAVWDTSRMTAMLNINLQTSAQRVIDQARRAIDLSGLTVLKLEVLDDELRTSRDGELLAASEALLNEDPGLAICPLVSCSVSTVRQVRALGCPLARVMGAPIASGNGIEQPSVFQEICGLGIPVVLDGGVGSLEHIETGLALGASGVLINSMLFGQARPAVDIMKEVVSGLRRRFGQPEVAVR